MDEVSEAEDVMGWLWAGKLDYDFVSQFMSGIRLVLIPVGAGLGAEEVAQRF